ncbi:MAG: acyl-CoA dehydrogenase [Geminicoccaceae bacterium]|nr:MAG: acyl-CoA dehydrogenase [Geminicoccaceae bacterium]
MTYRAPTGDLAFQLRHVAGFAGVAALPGFDDGLDELVEPVLDEAAKLAEDKLAPLNAVGDRLGATLQDGVVTMAPGFAEAFDAFVDGGWKALPFPVEHGGQNLPWSLAFAVAELWHSANLAFGNCPLLTQGAIEALVHHGTPAQRQRYLHPLCAGRWTATMCLTEPQAGSDLGAIQTKAVAAGDAYRLTGTKIYITYGEHDLADNILHLVLARLEGAPPGPKGVSLFLVPKWRLDAKGHLGERNHVHCLGLEHKLGIKAGPTCTLRFGDDATGEGAWAELVGQPHDGLRCMFTMMNNARLSVGLQGLAIAERACQQALAYARQRVQGQRHGQPTALIGHADVRRMLMTMQSQILAMRGLVLTAAAAIDHAARHPDALVRRRMAGRVELLTPIVKAWCTDLGVELASLAIQVHGGIGYIEETGAAQHLRDARIAPIYEGTNGIQALDLVGRKMRLDQGELPWQLFEELRHELRELEVEGAHDLVRGLRPALANAEAATRWIQGQHGHDDDAVSAGAAPYLRLMGQLLGGFVLVRGLRAAERLHRPDLPWRRAAARFYTEQLLPPASALLPAIIAGSTVLDPSLFDA